MPPICLQRGGHNVYVDHHLVQLLYLIFLYYVAILFLVKNDHSVLLQLVGHCRLGIRNGIQSVKLNPVIVILKGCFRRPLPLLSNSEKEDWLN